MKKRMLITGASQGIGKACVELFNDKYDVISVARSGDVTIRGDLTDPQFLNELIRTTTIDILINNAGILSPDFTETFRLNVEAASTLAIKYFEKMKSGHIINVCSTASNMRGWRGMSQERMWYIYSKSALKDLGVILQNSKNSNIKITNLEPGWVNTSFAGPEKLLTNEDYLDSNNQILPLKPIEIAQTIDWILGQPHHIVIPSLQIVPFEPQQT